MHVALIGAEHQEDLTVRYLWGALEAAGHEVTHVVFNRPEDLERAARALAATQAPLAGLSMVFTNRAAELARLAERARELGYRGHVTSGGHFAAFSAEALLRDVAAIDSVVVGEGEQAICELAEHLEALDSIEGLVFRAHDGAIVRNPARKKAKDLDLLPPPTRRRPFDDYLGIPIANLLGSRGCSYRCAFCSITAWHRMCGGAVLRLRSPEAVADEMADLYAEGVRIFNFHDDNFIVPNRRVMLARLDRLEAALAERSVGRIAFATKARPDELDPEMVDRLVSLGLFRLFIGIEAGAAKTLVQLGRTQALDDNERALALLNDRCVHTCFNLLLWNPDSTLEDIALNVDWLRDHPDNPMNFSRTEVYAGTPMLARLEAEGRLLGDYWGWDYVVADPRAERALQVAYAAFEERNFGPTSAHHLSMRVDYEYHLVRHFFGEDEDLRRRVKGFVREVNLDTVAHLSAILEACAEDRADEAFAARITAAVHESDERLGRAGRGLVLRLSRAVAPARETRTGPYARTALAAALSLGAAACETPAEPETPIVVEPPMMPGPVLEPAPVEEVAPVPPEPVEAPVESGVPLGDPEAIRGQFERRAMPPLVRSVRPPRDTRIELVIDDEGAVTEITVTVDGLGETALARLEARLGRLRFQGDDVVGQRFVLTITASQIRVAARTQTNQQQQVAHPVDDSWTHVREAAHNPYLDERVRPDPGGLK